MKERPIIFNTEMVKAILDGRKTQTRRPIKPQPRVTNKANDFFITLGMVEECPFGKVGDRLYVRETIALNRNPNNLRAVSPMYRADNSPVKMDCGFYKFPKGNTCSSIHMPRWASRITLEITDVRVERLQDINAEDSLAECVKWDGMYEHPRDNFIHLWNSIYKNWADNPWVWSIEFKLLEV